MHHLFLKYCICVRQIFYYTNIGNNDVLCANKASVFLVSGSVLFRHYLPIFSPKNRQFAAFQIGVELIRNPICD